MSEKEPAFTETNNVNVQERTPDQNQKMFEETLNYFDEAAEKLDEDPDAKLEAPSREVMLGIVAGNLLRMEEIRTGYKYKVELEKESPALHQRVNEYVALGENRLKKGYEIEESHEYKDATEDKKKEIIAKIRQETDQIYANEIESRFPSQEK